MIGFDADPLAYVSLRLFVWGFLRSRDRDAVVRVEVDVAYKSPRTCSSEPFAMLVYASSWLVRRCSALMNRTYVREFASRRVSEDIGLAAAIFR
jgi:hypothetical protein